MPDTEKNKWEFNNFLNDITNKYGSIDAYNKAMQKEYSQYNGFKVTIVMSYPTGKTVTGKLYSQEESCLTIICERGCSGSPCYNGNECKIAYIDIKQMIIE